MRRHQTRRPRAVASAGAGAGAAKRARARGPPPPPREATRRGGFAISARSRTAAGLEPLVALAPTRRGGGGVEAARCRGRSGRAGGAVVAQICKRSRFGRIVASQAQAVSSHLDSKTHKRPN